MWRQNKQEHQIPTVYSNVAVQRVSEYFTSCISKSKAGQNQQTNCMRPQHTLHHPTHVRTRTRAAFCWCCLTLYTFAFADAPFRNTQKIMTTMIEWRRKPMCGRKNVNAHDWRRNANGLQLCVPHSKHIHTDYEYSSRRFTHLMRQARAASKGSSPNGCLLWWATAVEIRMIKIPIRFIYLFERLNWIVDVVSDPQIKYVFSVAVTRMSHFNESRRFDAVSSCPKWLDSEHFVDYWITLSKSRYISSNRTSPVPSKKEKKNKTKPTTEKQKCET